jgi:hypothetical protein
MREMLHHYATQLLFAAPLIPVVLAVLWLAQQFGWSDQTFSDVIIVWIIVWATVVSLFGNRVLRGLTDIVFRRKSYL